MLCVNTYIKAADDPKWYEDREEALAIAKEQNKYVFLLYGRNSCSNCNAAKKFINRSPIKDIVQDNFILWFCNIDIAEKKSQAQGYRAYFDGGVTLPLLCVIDPLDPMPALSYSTDYQSDEEIQAILKSNMPTANEKIALLSNNISISDNMLTISNDNFDETISIYTISGQLIDSFNKKENIINRSTYSYPKGLLLINSSSGWNIKIMNTTLN